MNIICGKCGGNDILCEAMIDPNTKKFSHYTDESFLYEWCNDCQEGTILTDVDEVKNYMITGYRIFKESYNREPQYANCRIVWKNTGKTCNVKIMLSVNADDENNKTFYVCKSLDELLLLAEHGNQGFIVTECYGFAILTEKELLEQQTFEYKINGKSVSVTRKEVMDYYGEHYNLKKEEIERYAARYTCIAKYYKESDVPILDCSWVKRLLDEEKQMKKGERVYFKLRFTFLWHVTIQKDNDSFLTPPQIYAACLLP